MLACVCWVCFCHAAATTTTLLLLYIQVWPTTTARLCTRLTSSGLKPTAPPASQQCHLGLWGRRTAGPSLTPTPMWLHPHDQSAHIRLRGSSPPPPHSVTTTIIIITTQVYIYTKLILTFMKVILTLTLPHIPKNRNQVNSTGRQTKLNENKFCKKTK